MPPATNPPSSTLRAPEPSTLAPARSGGARLPKPAFMGAAAIRDGAAAALKAPLALLAALLAAAALSAAFPTAPASAWGSLNEYPVNTIGPELPRLRPETVTRSFVDSVCPNVRHEIVISRPAGTGDDILDRLLSAQSLAEARERELAPSFYEDSPECPAGGEAEASRTFEARSAAPGTLSVVYALYEFLPGAAHPGLGFESFAWTSRYGRELTMIDVIGDGGLARETLWREVVRRWCALGHPTLPGFYGFSYDFEACAAPRGVPMPDKLAGVAGGRRLADWGNAVPTPDGLVLTLGAYDSWSWAEGPSRITVPRSFFERIGAGGFWAN